MLLLLMIILFLHGDLLGCLGAVVLRCGLVVLLK